MLTYLNLLPSDLKTIILSFLDYQTIYIIKDDNICNYINWNYLILINTPILINPILPNFNMMYVYLGYLYENLCFSQNKYNVRDKYKLRDKYKVDIQKETGFNKKVSIELAKYCVYNNLGKMNRRTIAIIGDVDLVKFLKKENDLNLFHKSIIYNSYEIFDYLFPHNIDKNDDWVEFYEDIKIDIKITKRLLKHDIKYCQLICKYIYISDSDIENKSFDIETFIYILNEYKDWNIEDLVIMLKKYTKSYFIHIKFKLIINHFYDLLKDELLNIYIYLINLNTHKPFYNKELRYKMIGFLANLEPVKSYILRD